MVISLPSESVVEKVSSWGIFVAFLVDGVVVAASLEIVLIGCLKAFVDFYPL